MQGVCIILVKHIVSTCIHVPLVCTCTHMHVVEPHLPAIECYLHEHVHVCCANSSMYMYTYICIYTVATLQEWVTSAFQLRDVYMYVTF